MRTAARRGPRQSARRVVLVAAALAFGLVLYLSVGASDPPHWSGAVEQIDCTSNCHVPHAALGGGLNPQTGNTNLCQSCHNTNSLPIDSADLAMPGSGGTSHGFGVSPTNPAYGAQPPLHEQMSLRLLEGNVACSTCHDQHAALANDATPATGGTPRISNATEVVDQGGTGTVASGGTYSGPEGLWYLVDVAATGSESTARFRYSKDNGTSWFPTDCTPAATATCLTASPTTVALDNGVELTFSGGAGNAFQTGERWEFYGAYPFLRAPLDSGPITNTVERFCRDCHREWVMTHDSDLVAGGGVETWDGNPKSHPVGVGLNANARDYDRATPLDGNGLPQGAAPDPDVDGNPTNDLAFDASGNVQCLSCHAVHYADSVTETVDGP